MIEVASYAARWRSKGDYFTAGVIERFLGERRIFGPQGETLVQRCNWKIPDSRKCNDFSRDELESYGAEFPEWSVSVFWREQKAPARLEAYRKHMTNPKTIARIKQRLSA